MVFTDKQVCACGGLSVYTKFCTPSLGKLASKPQEMVKFINTESPVVNASHALSRLYTSFEVKQPLSKCFGGKKLADITTASTDHACVDAAGFKR